MAANLPAKLKIADITRYAQRASQLEKLKPPIAYWCYYWIVNQILAKGLHTQDEECMTYTTDLVDKLEEFKVQYATNDAIIDDVAGQAYVEQFGLETFQRADNAVRANKASKQTAETFQAAGTFLDLVQIWGAPSPEIASKIKYAKYHALRIARALKAGEDPNLSNPEPEPRIEDAVQLDPNDPEVQRINDAGQRQPSVEDVPDEHDRVQRSLAVQSTADQSLHPSRASSLPRPAAESPPLYSLPSAADTALPETSRDQASPFQPPTNPRHNSAGGGYFPELPPNIKEESPDIGDPMDFSMGTPSAPPTASVDDAQDFYTTQSPAPAAPFSPPFPRPEAHSYAAAPSPQQTPRLTAAPPSQIPQQAPQVSQDYLADDDAVLDAQKHAKWAISALNFEDVPTAVKELRLALRALGAQ